MPKESTHLLDGLGASWRGSLLSSSLVFLLFKDASFNKLPCLFENRSGCFNEITVSHLVSL